MLYILQYILLYTFIYCIFCKIMVGESSLQEYLGILPWCPVLKINTSCQPSSDILDELVKAFLPCVAHKNVEKQRLLDLDPPSRCPMAIQTSWINQVQILTVDREENIPSSLGPSDNPKPGKISTHLPEMFVVGINHPCGCLE